MSRYYARSYKEKEFDDRIRETAKSTQDPYKMAMYVQGQATLNLLRRIDDKLKGYPIQDGYMGWIDQNKRYRLFATEADYREFIGGEEEDADRSRPDMEG